MSTELSARFKLVDEMSSKLERIATSGDQMISKWENAQRTTEKAVENISSGAERASRAVESSAGAYEYWTAAADRFDKSALKATYSTEELVEMGLKSTKALEEQQREAASLEREMAAAADEISSVTAEQKSLIDALKKATSAQEKLTKAGKDDTDISKKLAEATEAAKEAQNRLSAAHDTAAKAMERYTALAANGEATMDELEEASLDAREAAEELAKAHQEASDATEALGKTSEEAGNELKKSGDNGEKAAKQIMEALQIAAIAKTIKEITAAVIEMTNEFSRAESTIAKATGATGAELDRLTQSTMDAYAAARSGDLDMAAKAAAEINTRMHLQGEELSDTTAKFLDYANVTGNDVVKSVEQTNQIMNKWKDSGLGVSEILDRLTYATQTSGAEVGELSQLLIDGAATYQQVGLSLDNTINLLTDFESAGINATRSVAGLRQGVSYFACEGIDIKTGLLDTVEAIGAMADETEATALAVKVFGAEAGQELAYAIRSGALSVETFTGTLDEAAGALELTAAAAQSTEDKWDQAGNSMKAAFDNAMGPTVENFSNLLADGVNGIGDFLYENEEVAKVIGSVATGLGVAAAAVVAYMTVTKIAIPLITKFVAALAATSFGVKGAVILGAAAAVTALVVAFNDADDEFKQLSASSQRQQKELEALNSEYEETCKLYGETSAEAIAMKGAVDEATAAFEANKRTTEEVNASIDATVSSYNSVADSAYSAWQEVMTEGRNATTLVTRLKELSRSSENTAGAQQQMKLMLEELNRMFPELELNVDGTAASIEGMTDKVEAYLNSTQWKNEHDAAVQMYTKLTTEVDRDALYKAAMDAGAEYRKIANDIDIENPADFFARTWQHATGSGLVAEEREAKERWEAAQKALNDYDAQLQECIDTLERYGTIVDGTSDIQINQGDAIIIATEAVADSATTLMEAYQNAYKSARESIDGQIGLFEQMAMSCEISTDEMIAALESQSDYLATYTQNLQRAAQYGLDEGLIAALSDGSDESAGHLNAIIDKVDELGTDSEEAKKFIEEMNQAFIGSEAAKDKFAEAVAEQETDFSNELDNIATEMEETIDRLNMSDEAAEAAKQMMEAYIDALNSGKTGAVEAADLISQAVAAAFMIPAATSESPGGGGGRSRDVSNAATNDYEKVAPSAGPVEVVKRLFIEVAGSGKIGVDGINGEGAIINAVNAVLKPALMELLGEEILEEGEGAYDY